MDFQRDSISIPIKVLVVNPLAPSSRLLLVKLLCGEIFGNEAIVDLKLLVYANEIPAAEALIFELERCVFPNTNLLEISTVLPNARDADVFCFISDFENPNCCDISKMECTDHFDTLYLLIKIANNLSWPNEGETEELLLRKPIFVTDGLMALDIFVSLSKNMPYDIFFCPIPIEAIAKSILGEYLNVKCNEINDVLVWAANDQIFYVEVVKPVIIHDKEGEESKCDSNMISKERLKSLKLDQTQFNDSWMKKEFIEKVSSSAARNPYGCIYKASQLAKTLRQIWLSRSNRSSEKLYSNMGVISDGSFDTLKGYPYVLPLIFSGDNWSVYNRFEESTYLKQEIKRINKAVKEQHQKLIPYCKKFLQENVINLAFIPVEESSVYEAAGSSNRSLVTLN